MIMLQVHAKTQISGIRTVSMPSSRCGLRRPGLWLLGARTHLFSDSDFLGLSLKVATHTTGSSSHNDIYGVKWASGTRIAAAIDLRLQSHQCAHFLHLVRDALYLELQGTCHTFTAVVSCIWAVLVRVQSTRNTVTRRMCLNRDYS